MNWNRRSSIALAAATLLTGAGFAVAANAAEAGRSVPESSPSATPSAASTVLDDHGTGGQGPDDAVVGSRSDDAGTHEAGDDRLDPAPNGSTDPTSHDLGDDRLDDSATDDSATDDSATDDSATDDSGRDSDGHGDRAGTSLRGGTDDPATHDAGDDHGARVSGGTDDAGTHHGSGSHS